MIFDNAIRVTEHFLHTSTEILRISKIAFQKSQKTIAFFIYFLNNSIDVTQHFLHTSNELLRLSKIAFQKRKKTPAFCICFE